MLLKQHTFAYAIDQFVVIAADITLEPKIFNPVKKIKLYIIQMRSYYVVVSYLFFRHYIYSQCHKIL